MNLAYNPPRSPLEASLWRVLSVLLTALDDAILSAI